MSQELAWMEEPGFRDYDWVNTPGWNDRTVAGRALHAVAKGGTGTVTLCGIRRQTWWYDLFNYTPCKRCAAKLAKGNDKGENLHAPDHRTSAHQAAP